MRFIFSIAFFLSFAAHAEIQVFPTYILLQGKAKSAHLTVQNSSDEKKTLAIKAVFFRMKKDGSYHQTEPLASERHLLNRLKFSPREAVLEPGQKQVVRLLLMDGPELNSADAYAHILFEPLEPPAAKDSPKAKEIQMAVEARMAIAVPVVFRPLKSNRKPVVKELKVLPQADSLKISTVIENQSNETFLFGDIDLKFEDDTGKTHDVFHMKGLSSYLPTRSWDFTLAEKDQIEKASKFKNGKWRIIYKSSEGDPDPFEAALTVPFKKL